MSETPASCAVRARRVARVGTLQPGHRRRRRGHGGRRCCQHPGRPQPCPPTSVPDSPWLQRHRMLYPSTGCWKVQLIQNVKIHGAPLPACPIHTFPLPKAAYSLGLAETAGGHSQRLLGDCRVVLTPDRNPPAPALRPVSLPPVSAHRSPLLSNGGLRAPRLERRFPQQLLGQSPVFNVAQAAGWYRLTPRTGQEMHAPSGSTEHAFHRIIES